MTSRARAPPLPPSAQTVERTVVYAERTAFAYNLLNFGVGVGRETVYGDNTRKFINIFDVGNMAEQVGKSFARASRFSVPSSVFGTPPCIFKSANRGNNNDGGR